MSNVRLGLLLVGIGLLALACGDADTGTAPGGPDSNSPGFAGDTTPGVDPDTGLPLGDVAPDTAGEPTGPKLEIIILHDTTYPVQVQIQDEFIIRAKVVDYGAGKPAEDVEVAYDIVTNEGMNGMAGDAQLSAKAAYSDQKGEVENTFRANYVGDVNYTVRLSAEGAEDVFIDIIVSDTPKGSIEVHLEYEGPININTIKVRLMPKTFICGSYKPTANISGSLADKTVLDISSTPVFDGLAAGSHFTLVATAKSPKGALAAAGCKDGVFVIAGQKTPTTMNLYLLPLIPTGSYDVDNYFDFTTVLPELGTVGLVIEGIVTLFNDPGKFLIDQIKNLVKIWLGEIIGGVVEAAFGLFENELAGIITDWAKNDSPEWMQDFFTIGDDLTQIVDNLHLISVLKVSKLHNDYYFQGTQYWNGIVFSWKFGCDKDAPDYDTCGLYKFSMEAFADTQFPQDIIEGHFTGSIVNYDKLFIDNHTIQLSYGKLILFVLNELLLPAISGENNMKDAALKFVNCPGIAKTFSNSILDGIGLEEKDIEKYCKTTISLLLSPLEAWIGSLAIDSQLWLTGQCTLLEETDDLYVDKLLDGKYSGTVEIEGGAGPSFKGSFSGVKQTF